MHTPKLAKYRTTRQYIYLPFYNNSLQLVAKLALALICSAMLAGCDTQERGKRADAFSLQAYQGKWVILNYWAEWCGPCVEEIPELNALQKNHSQDLVVLGVNFDKISGGELHELARQMHIGFALVDPDPADILRLSRPASLPTTYLYNPAGELAFKLVGPQTAASLLEKIGLPLRVSPVPPAK